MEYKQVLSILFLEEVWNSFFCEFSERARKYHHSTLSETLKSGGYIDGINTTDNNLYLFLQNYCMNEIPMKNLIGANLL
jgi:hypothetical protein